MRRPWWAPAVLLATVLAAHVGAPPGRALEAAAVPATTHLAVPALVRVAAERYGLDAEYLLRIGHCESRLGQDPAAYDRSAPHAGVFQFAYRGRWVSGRYVPSTWEWASAAAGYGGADPLDDEANVGTAAWLLATEGPRHWPNCRWR